MAVLHLKGLHLQDQSAAVVEWEGELTCHVNVMVMADLHEENQCHPGEMYICPQEMMVTAKMGIPAEITLAPGIQEIMRHHLEIMHTVNMGIPVVMNMDQEGTVTGTVMVRGIETTTILVAPTEIRMMAMVTHVVLRLHEGHRHHMVEAADMMITAALGMAMVAVATVTQAGMRSTQVAVNVLADRNVAFLLLWIEAILHHVIHTAVQAVEHHEVDVEEVALKGARAGADTK